ncbi:MAG: prepilin-type N-terminal cleavage/methylation domain-containing protein [PVC group bacterium]|nr:prepilin-type N-terminal cleavage/methylation domain-containing protein [PVC group bacterium]
MKFKKRYLTDKSGFTLTEMIVSLGIYTVVIGTLFSALISHNYFTDQCLGKWDISKQARKVVNDMVKEMRVSKGTYAEIYDMPIDQGGAAANPNAGKSIVFQVPVGLDAYGRIEWGAEANIDWSIEYCWDDSSNQILRRVWDDSNTLIDQVITSEDVADFKVTGYKYDAGSKGYVVDSLIELVEIEIKTEKDTLRGRCLSDPLNITLNNRVYWRN